MTLLKYLVQKITQFATDILVYDIDMIHRVTRLKKL